jgi:hypothetical protein
MFSIGVIIYAVLFWIIESILMWHIITDTFGIRIILIVSAVFALGANKLTTSSANKH